MSNQNRTNLQILSNSDRNAPADTAYNFISAITINRDFESNDEAWLALNSVNKVLSFVEYGTRESDPHISDSPLSIVEGISEIIHACRLISLRAEEHLCALANIDAEAAFDLKFRESNK